jgi:hypothetical protein
VPSFFHQRINAGSARLIVITSSAQCSPTETVESDISIWANGDFSIWRLQTCFADPMLWNIIPSTVGWVYLSRADSVCGGISLNRRIRRATKGARSFVGDL